MISHQALGAPGREWLARLWKAGNGTVPEETYTYVPESFTVFPAPRPIPMRPKVSVLKQAPELTNTEYRMGNVDAWYNPEWSGEYETVFGKVPAMAGSDW